ncbi:hypothetical protein [Lysobacter sp. A03]|uniref:hypothetical protein n=1 Tax=Lysobacter sp. A03 TaxID=1199154 RepID=UPI0005B6E8B6|nr:hypothetical protein [Lysobacter sp. A03]KIQ96689.1 hypothetical protein TI01_1805 [Lysobacter sp. A03]
MNASLFVVSPLPASLFSGAVRLNSNRHSIGDFVPDPVRLAHFNALLMQISAEHPQIDGDQLATAARELILQARDGRIPQSIRERIRRAGAMDLMQSDPEWETEAKAAIAAATALDYLHGKDTLIPHSLPVVGWLDGAVVVETAWPTLADEVRDYLDFCRLRRIEAGLRGESRRHFGFTRDQLDDARTAEWLWTEHCRRTGRSSYLSQDEPGRFRVN